MKLKVGVHMCVRGGMVEQRERREGGVGLQGSQCNPKIIQGSFNMFSCTKKITSGQIHILD